MDKFIHECIQGEHLAIVGIILLGIAVSLLTLYAFASRKRIRKLEERQAKNNERLKKMPYNRWTDPQWKENSVVKKRKSRTASEKRMMQAWLAYTPKKPKNSDPNH
ncbi:hypothetical protein JW758_03690 [Candidatus Peregrinibacteria bacterium]|nr:hypothetical protein [Candidatus Peregrinibacteria bacterium]